MSADSTTAPPARTILGVRVDATSYGDATDRVMRWAGVGQSRYVCVATVNNLIEAHDDAQYREIMRRADLVTPDGMPLVWGLRLLGIPSATRVYGPDLTPIICERAAELGIPVGFYGGEPEVLDALTTSLERRYLRLEVSFSHSPPFRPLDHEEEEAMVRAINQSGARILFVGLGAPRQERWIAEQKGKVNAVMLGVGAAFDFLAGRKRQAPKVVQHLGLEWLFRLIHEPRRLWRRYLYRNPRFVVLFASQLARHRRPGPHTTS